MAPHLNHCQQFSAARRAAPKNLLGLAVLSLVCLGCWQEVRYEPEGYDPEEAALPAASAVDPRKTSAADTSSAPSPAAESTSKVSSEDWLGISNSEDLQPSTAIAEVPESPVVAKPLDEPLKSLGESLDKPSTGLESASTEPLSLPLQEEGGGVAIEEATPVMSDPFGEEAFAENREAEGGENTAPIGPYPSAEANSPLLARTHLAAWQLCSKWSMAAALQAKGRDLDSYGDLLEAARDAAKLLNVTLPELPTHEVGVDRLAENLQFLLEAAGPRLADELNVRHGADHAALAELATKTHVLLLSYTPSSPKLEPVVDSIRQAARQSGLPADVWQELVDLLTARAEFKSVKAAIFKLHSKAFDYLNKQSVSP